MSSETTHIEHDLEQTRARLDATIGALQDKLSPGQLVDQALDYFRSSGGAEFGRNLKDNVQGNPMPVALVGIGLAWLMMGGNRRPEPVRGYAYESADIPWEDDEPLTEEEHSLRSRADEAATKVSRTASESYEAFQERVYDAKASVLGVTRNVGESISAFAGRIDHAMRRTGRAGRSAAGSVGRGMGSAADGISSAAGSVRHGIGAAASGARHGLSSAADGARQGMNRAGQGMGSAARGMRDAGGSTLGFLADQPLLLGALGVSVGALLAAVLPSTRTEDELMGEFSDDLRERAQEAGSSAMRSGARVASDMMGAASEAAEREGLTSDSANSAAETARSGISDATQRVRHVVEETVSAGRDAAQREFGGQQEGNEPRTGAAIGESSPGGTKVERDLGIGTSGSTSSPGGDAGRAAAQPTIGTSPRVHGYDERSAR